jgi:hypothetical protein
MTSPTVLAAQRPTESPETEIREPRGELPEKPEKSGEMTHMQTLISHVRDIRHRRQRNA